MKRKRILALITAAVMAISAVGCGNAASSDTAGDAGSTAKADKAGSNKLVVWTLSEDLKSFAQRYTEQYPDMEIETIIIPPADYPTKLTAALRGKAATPDIIVGEPQMLPDFMDAGFFEDLTKEPYNVGQYKDMLMDYVWEVGQDEEGIQRAVSYQITPGGIFYRRDIAKEVWGTDAPEDIALKFKDYAAIVASGKELRDKGYRIFADGGNLRWFANNKAWAADGKLVVSPERLEYFDAAVEMYQNKLYAFAPEWSAAWFASMAGSIPMNAEWQELSEVDASAEKTEVFSYTLPSWGAVTIRDNAKENADQFGICAGPVSFFGGGTFLGINTYSKNKEKAWDFIKFVTLNEETSKWWADTSNGDIVSMKSVLEEYKDKENSAYGNQKTYAFFYEEAAKIDPSLITRYDDTLGKFYGQAIESAQKGDKTKEEALKEFYNNVRSVYPELEITE